MIFTLLVAAFAGGLLSATQTPNPDAAWLLIATGRFMDGAIVGRDLFELNPPLIYWLMAPSVWLSRWLGSDYYATYCLWVGLIASLSCALSCKTMTQAGIGVVRARFAALAGLALFFCISSSDYGQRDPLAYELASPFLLTEALRAKGQPGSRYITAAIAAIAAIGFLLKPYMAVVPVGLFAWRVIREGTLAVMIAYDVLIMLAMAAAYVAYVVFCTPAYFNVAYLALIAYPAYDSTCIKLLISFVPPTLATLFLWLVMVRMPPGPTAASIHTLLVATVAFIAGALTQLKGWYYHLVPSYLALCSSCIVYLVVDQPGGSKRPLVRWVAWTLPLFFVVIGIGRASYFERATVTNWDIAKVISSSRTGTFLAITTSLWGVFPAVNEMGVQWASGSDVQWLVPAAVELSKGTSQQRERADKLRLISSSRLVADLKRWKPDRVAVKVGSDQGLSSPVDWIAFFGRDKGFVNVWSMYCAEGRTGDWDVYRRCLSSE